MIAKRFDLRFYMDFIQQLIIHTFPVMFVMLKSFFEKVISE